MSEYTPLLVDAASRAVDLALPHLATGQDFWVAVEDSSHENVVGFGRIFITNDYYHPDITACPNSQKLWLNRRFTINGLRSTVLKFLRHNCKILPLRIEEAGEVIDLNVLYKTLRLDHDVTVAHRMIDELCVKRAIDIQVVN